MRNVRADVRKGVLNKPEFLPITNPTNILGLGVDGALSTQAVCDRLSDSITKVKLAHVRLFSPAMANHPIQGLGCHLLG